MLSWLTEKMMLAYIYSTITFLLLSLCFKSIRERSASFLNLSNLIVLITLAINLIHIGTQTVDCKIDQIEHLSNNKIDGYDFYYSRNCFTVFIWNSIFTFLIQTPFLYKRYRQKMGLTILSIFSLLIILNLERVVNFITNLYRDYLPSSWSVYYDTTDRLWTIAFSIFQFVICWTIPLVVQSKRTK